MISAVLAAAFLLADTTAALQPAAEGAPVAKPAAAVAAKSKPDDSTTVVCKTEVVVGSRLGVKHCRTKADAEMQKMEDRQALERAQTQIHIDGR
jgi:hypothetical protein